MNICLTASVQDKTQLRDETYRCMNQKVQYTDFVDSKLLRVAF